MMLDSTSKTLEVVLAGAVATAQLTVTCKFVDLTTNSSTGGLATVSTNDTTAVTCCPAPAASTQRSILGVAVYNGDTATATVTIRINDGATLYTQVKIVVVAGSTLQYTDTDGWKVLLSDGSVKTGIAGPAGTDGIAKLNGINDQTGTSYTLAIADAGKDVRCTNAAAITLTIPPNSSVAFPVGTIVLFSQGGAGVVTATAGSGVTLVGANGTTTSGQYDIRGLEKTGTDTWRVV